MNAFAATPALLEELMRSRTYEYQSDFARKYFQEGLEEGRQEGREALVHALLQLLAVRGIDASDDQKQQIAAAEVADLEQWIPRAAVCTAIDEVFGA